MEELLWAILVMVSAMAGIIISSLTLINTKLTGILIQLRNLNENFHRKVR